MATCSFGERSFGSVGRSPGKSRRGNACRHLDDVPRYVQPIESISFGVAVGWRVEVRRWVPRVRLHRPNRDVDRTERPVRESAAQRVDKRDAAKLRNLSRVAWNGWRPAIAFQEGSP